MNDECNTDVLQLNHDAPEDFERCVCQAYDGLSLIYVAVIRLIYFYYYGIILCCIILMIQRPELKFIIFFDYWTLALTNLLPQLCMHWFGLNKHSYRTNWSYMPWAYRAFWAFYSAALPSTFLSTVVFWSLVYSHKTHIILIIINTATPAIVFIQFLLIAFPLRLLHFYFFILFYLLYIIFTVVYQKCGGTGIYGSTPIYKVLDWRNPGKAILYTFIGLAIGELFYLIFCLLSMGKLYLRDIYL